MAKLINRATDISRVTYTFREHSWLYMQTG